MSAPAPMRRIVAGGQKIPDKLRELADEIEREGIGPRSLGIVVLGHVDNDGVAVDCIPLGGCDILRSLGLLDLAKFELARDGAE